ncbi:MAG: HAD-IC family P-type ATPase [Thermodesulfobacteriota bacterium]
MIQALHTAVAGRARFKVEGLYRSQDLQRLLEFRLARVKEITRVSASSLTGNVLVCFNSNSTTEDITALLAGIVAECRALPEASSLRPPRPTPGSEPSGAASYLPSLRGMFSFVEEQPRDSWHLVKAEAALKRWGTSKVRGLTPDTVKENQGRYGPNMLPEAEPRSGLSIFLEQFNSLPVFLLGAAAGLSVFTGGLVDAVLIAGVVVGNALIGYKTEVEAEKTIRSLQTMVRPTALVVRQGDLREISTDEVTLGDLCVLRPGSYVPADGRLVAASHLSLDESALTGESLPVVKTAKALRGDNIPLADRVNLVFMGTLVTGGEGLMVVVATGSYTEIGKIQTLAGEAEAPDTPLQRQLDQLGNRLVWLCFGLCGLSFGMGLFWGYGWLEMLRMAVCLAAAAVPEGLPAAATTTLALGIRDMRRHHVLIRHLHAVETLGAVQTICLDKTGTITKNEMAVREIFTGMRPISVAAGQFFAPEGPISFDACEELAQLITVSVLCNETEIHQEGGEVQLSGTPTESTLVRLALQLGLDVPGLRRQYPLVHINYRSENRPFMGSLHENGETGPFLALKGSPLEVLALCAWQLREGEKVPLTEEDRGNIEAANERMAGKAYRVLGLALASGDGVRGLEEPQDLVWLGIIGMADPIREGVGQAIKALHQAGVRTVMITGDQSPTAYAIGQELALSRREPLEILDATHLGEMDSEALRALAQRAHVFARVSPAHKLKIVQALQKSGQVVAMTGDGINDGPALKAADVGIAMGRTGTDIAREVADVVLEKDNLDTLIIAIRDGRTTYINIKKSVHFFLSTNLSEIMLTGVALMVGLGSPLTAIQLLWINLISDIFPGLALSLEESEPDVLQRPPRNPHDPIFNAGDFKRMAFESGVLTAGALGAYGYGWLRYGLGPQASTLAFHSLTAGQLLHAVSCRSERHSIFSQEKLPPNRYLNLALGGSLLVQAAAMFLPGVRSILGLAPVGLLDGLVIAGTSLLPLLVNESTKTLTLTISEEAPPPPALPDSLDF